MTEWQPIETAPKDQIVELGRWELWSGNYKWQSEFYRAWEPHPIFWWRRVLSYQGQRFTHWRFPPPPPLTEANT